MRYLKYVFIALVLSASSIVSAQTWVNGSIGIHTPNASITLGGNNYRRPAPPPQAFRPYYPPPPVYVTPPPVYVAPPPVIHLPPPGVIVPNGSQYHNPTWYNPNLRYDYRYVNPN